jgi:endonuclease/exonuclease/phosphatase family metal-dependent hydrolase
MKISRSVFFGFITLIGMCVSDAADQVVRLVTWNLQWFPGKSPYAKPEAVKLHIAELREAVIALRPDILVLQEASNEDALIEAIPDHSGLKLAVMSRFRNSAGFIDGQQIAIFSRFPADFIYSSAWKRSWAGPPRGFALASMKINGSSVNVVGLHLKSNLGDPQGNTAKREDATEQVLEHLRLTAEETGIKGTPGVICGDFNTDSVNRDVPSERTFKLMEEAGFFWAFEGVPHHLRITCPPKGKYPAACFDHIFLRGLGRPVAAPVPQISGSDHTPVVVEFEVLQK